MKTKNAFNSRRDFINKTVIVSSGILIPNITYGKLYEENDFPLIDYHVHLTKQFTIEKAITLAEKKEMKFGIVEHPGPGYAIQTDYDLKLYIEKLRKFPVYVGLQPVYLNWSKDFSRELLDKIDHVLMDADTIPLENGHYLRIWQHDNYIENINQFMDLYINHIENILKYEPITIFARPTYLPINFARYYDKLWTNDRVSKIIELAKNNNIALEISTPMHVPSKKIILQAKAAGLKFTFGTNARNFNAGKFHYGLQMAKECNLTADNMLII